MSLLYGFMSSPDGRIIVDPVKSNIVRTIYQQYLSGMSLGGIADFLFEHGIPSPKGKDRWTQPVLSNLLSNQKYVGYIVSFDDFFLAQGEKSKRSNIDEDTNKRKVTRYNSQCVLSGLLVCAECNHNYRRITRPSGEIVWRCANRVEHGKMFCKHSPSISEERININIVWWYLDQQGLDRAEWFDVVIFRYLLTVKRWFALPELQQVKFVTLACSAMRSAIGNERRKRANEPRTVSLYEPIPGTDDLLYIDTVAAPEPIFA